MKIKGIIFDCDGTIIDSEDIVIDSIQLALKQTGVTEHSREEIHSLLGPGADEIFKKLIKDEKKAEEAFGYYLQSQLARAHEMKVYKGIIPMLETIKNHQVPCAMVTGRHSKDLLLVLQEHKLRSYFDVIVSDDDLKSSKPNPEGLALAAIKLHLSPDDLVYVGDAAGDIETAHSSGAQAIAALWDKRIDKKKIEEKKPEFMADRPEEVCQYIFSQNQGTNFDVCS